MQVGGAVGVVVALWLWALTILGLEGKVWACGPSVRLLQGVELNHLVMGETSSMVYLGAV